MRAAAESGSAGTLTTSPLRAVSGAGAAKASVAASLLLLLAAGSATASPATAMKDFKAGRFAEAEALFESSEALLHHYKTYLSQGSVMVRAEKRP